MPDFLTPALQQAYAMAEPGDDIVVTIELNHSSFIDGPERFVTGQDTDLTATLEVGAPFDSGEAVVFRPMAFEFIPPGHDGNGPTTAKAKIDNVSGEIARIMRQTISSNEPVEIIYREYALSDLTEPGQVLYGLMLKKVQTTAMTAMGDVGWREVQLQAFPRQIYDKTRYPAVFAL